MNFIWTGFREDRLTQLWGEGYSASQVAKTLTAEFGGGLTRSAVIGKVYRLRLPLRATRVRSYVDQDRSLTQRVKRRPRVVDKYLPIGEQPAEQPSSPVKLLDAQDKHCRWPLGDPSQPDFMFCGATRHIEIRKDGKQHEKPYCARHCRMAYASPRAAQTPAFIDRGSMRRFA